MRRHRGVLRGRVPALRLVPAYRHARPDPGEGCTRARAHARTRSTPTLPGWAHAAPMQSPWQVLATRCAGRPARGPASRSCPMASVGCVCTALAALPCAASLPVARLGPVAPHTAFRRVLLHWSFGSLDGRHCGTRWHVGDCGRWGEACTSRWRARRGAAWSGVARQWQVGDGRELRLGGRRRGLRSSSCAWTMFGAPGTLSLSCARLVEACGVFLGLEFGTGCSCNTQSPPRHVEARPPRWGVRPKVPRAECEHACACE